MLHVPMVQRSLATYVSEALSEKIGTKVSVGRIDLGFFNRLIIDDVNVPDQWGENLLKTSRLSVKISLYELAKGKISISAIQLFGMKANVYKDVKKGQFNFQFIADSLQQKEKKESKPIDLQINSLIIRNGALSFRQQKEHTCSTQKMTPNDVELRDISAHIILNKLTPDSIAVKIKRLALKEKGGLQLRSLAFAATAGRHGAELRNFNLELPNSDISIPHLTASYSTDKNSIILATLQYSGSIDGSNISPADFAFLLPSLRISAKNNGQDYGAAPGAGSSNGAGETCINLHTTFSGTSSALTIKDLAVASTDGGFRLKANGALSDMQAARRWSVNINDLHATAAFAQMACKATGTTWPETINDKLFVQFKGSAGGNRNDVSMRGQLLSSAGNLTLMAGRHNGNMTAEAYTKNFNVAGVINGCDVAGVAAHIKAKGTDMDHMTVNCVVESIEFKKNTYKDIRADITTQGTVIRGKIAVNDTRGQINVEGAADRSPKKPSLNLTAEIRNLYPAAIGVLTKQADLAANMNIKADISGHSLNDIVGNITFTDMAFAFSDEIIVPGDITITSHDHGKDHNLSLNSNFCQMSLTGQFNYHSILTSMKNIVAKHIQSLPGTTLTYEKKHSNNFTMCAKINDTRLLRKLTGANFIVDQPLTIKAMLDDHNEQVDMKVNLPAFAYNGTTYKDLAITARTTNDTLHTDMRLKKLMANNKITSYMLDANAANNTLGAILRLNDNEDQPVRGTLSTRTHFYKNEEGTSVAHVELNPSVVTIGDTVWQVLPATVEYAKDNLRVNGFKICHDKQSIAIDGRATKDLNDSLNVELKDINISYILNLVNFHSVEFSGMATGTATVAAPFAQQPKAYARLRVDDFRFEDGRMGTLHANVDLNNSLKQIDIAAEAIDRLDNNGTERRTIIEGNVSPQRNDIKLDITAKHTRIEFMHSFCSSFMDNIDGEANGKVTVAGPLSNINLTGQLLASGSMRITPLNTTYTMKNARVRCIPDAIYLENDTIYDRNGNIGIVNGKLGHQHLTRLTYDIGIEAQHLLAYDTHTFDGNTFYGTAYMTGDCHINGRSGEVTINVNGVPEKGSVVVYNVASPDAIGTQDFLTWTSHHKVEKDTLHIASSKDAEEDKERDIASDMKINFLINCTPDATIKLLMDNQSGDYITLNGHGVLKANYFNKGGFDLFGNYVVDTGHYKLTVQNFLKRDFLFRQGGTINFGGDPFAATLNLNAVYSLASVSLADLNIGKSFTSNNTKVDCIMNISGTPAAPHVDFSLDIPSISSDARQMVYSLINSEEEMNQQVLYLLAVGRFMAQGRNNAGVDNPNQQSQASLAMQSILSGTIMQQVNEVLGSLTSHSNWNFGANISTGTEGFNNAEYEGLLSGRLLSGRLLVDGQFGYRDNANATTSFIGDFDLKYLLYPNGNLAINFYNKTNDRYFTRNSLNTQGIGLLMKKDFSSLSDLFGLKRKKGKKKTLKTQSAEGYVQKKRQGKNSETK